MQENIKISDIRAFVVETVGVGGDYGSRPGGHWIVDAPQCNPLSIYENHAELRGGDASLFISYNRLFKLKYSKLYLITLDG